MISKGERPAIISNMRTPSAHQSTLNPREKQAFTRQEVAGKPTHSVHECERAKGSQHPSPWVAGLPFTYCAGHVFPQKLQNWCVAVTCGLPRLLPGPSPVLIATQTCIMGPRKDPALFLSLPLFGDDDDDDDGEGLTGLQLIPSCLSLVSACHHNWLFSCFHLKLQSSFLTEECSSVVEHFSHTCKALASIPSAA